tara:strand:- start:1111 stop:2214 length:1104 start_codon:yes stop_codon:yes gene_type:complete
LEAKYEKNRILTELGITSFKERFPWIGGDLQTLRDTFRQENLGEGESVFIEISVPSLVNTKIKAGKLLALLNLPFDKTKIRGLILMIHGLGGSSRRLGLRRMALNFQSLGFATLRLNLRGADPGRHLSAGTYSAKCNSDIEQVFHIAKEICQNLSKDNNYKYQDIPLFGVGISLGGTILINACLSQSISEKLERPLFKGLACTSSPLDLTECSKEIERPRNYIYQKWLLKRLVKQTLADPFMVDTNELKILSRPNDFIKSIRDFDNYITAPRWGFKDVKSYYKEASPLLKLIENPELPPTLFLQAKDDPWVPYLATEKLMKEIYSQDNSKISILLSQKGGHNGFHGNNGCWGDHLVGEWFNKLSNKI